MDDRDRPASLDEATTPGHATGTDPVIDQVIPPPDDGQLHSDLGQVSGGVGEEVAHEGGSGTDSDILAVGCRPG